MPSKLDNHSRMGISKDAQEIDFLYLFWHRYTKFDKTFYNCVLIWHIIIDKNVILVILIGQDKNVKNKKKNLPTQLLWKICKNFCVRNIALIWFGHKLCQLSTTCESLIGVTIRVHVLSLCRVNSWVFDYISQQ